MSHQMDPTSLSDNVDACWVNSKGRTLECRRYKRTDIISTSICKPYKKGWSYVEKLNEGFDENCIKTNLRRRSKN